MLRSMADDISGALPGTTTTFMRTCHQIYHEAADYLYSRGRIGITVDGDSLHMLYQDFKPAIEPAPCPGALTYVRRLDFRIRLDLQHGIDLREICSTHMTTSYLADLVKRHQMHDLSIFLDMQLPQYLITSSKKDTRTQLLRHNVGDVTWQHIAAFVMDPLRDIQVRRGGKVNFDRPLHMPQVFQLPVFRQLPADLTEAMRAEGQGAESNDNYSSFVPYLEALETVDDIVLATCKMCFDSSQTTPWNYMRHGMECPLLRENIKPVLHNIRCSVIRGDVEALRRHHEEYVRKLLLVFEEVGMCDPEHIDHDSGSPLKPLPDDRIVSLSCALAMMGVAFPKNVSTFDLGPMHVERAIARWKHDCKSKVERKFSCSLSLDDLIALMEEEREEQEISGEHLLDDHNEADYGDDGVYFFDQLCCTSSYDIESLEARAADHGHRFMT